MFHRTSWVFDGLSHADLEADVGFIANVSVGGGAINLYLKEEGTNQRAQFILGGYNAGFSIDGNPFPFSVSRSTPDMYSWGSHVYKGPAGAFVSAETFAGPVIVGSAAFGLVADSDVKIFYFLAMNDATSVSRFMAMGACGGPTGVAAGLASNVEAAMLAGGDGLQMLGGGELQAGIYYSTFRRISYPPGSARQRAFNALTQDQRNLVFMEEWQIFHRWGAGSGRRVLAYRNHLREQFPNYEQYGR